MTGLIDCVLVIYPNGEEVWEPVIGQTVDIYA